MLAVIESLDQYRWRGHVPGAQESRIRSLYPRSGVYRTGVKPAIVWELDDFPEMFRYLRCSSDEQAVHSFFVRDERVYLVATSPEDLLRFYVDGELVSRVGQLDLMSAPWQSGALGPCSGGL